MREITRAAESYNYFLTISESLGPRHWENLDKDTPLHDPFIHTTVHLRGWRVAWAVLRGRYKLFVRIRGTDEAHRAVFNADYTPRHPPRGYVFSEPQRPTR